MRAIFHQSEIVSDNIQTFYFDPVRPVRYEAGQFIELTLHSPSPDERGIKHWFTLSSSPTEERLSITTRFTPDRGSTFKQTLLALKPGQEVNMSDPMGDFVLPTDKSRPLVFVAGGIGITPMRSMIKWLHDNQEQRTIQLIYATSTPEELVFRELFASYGLPVTLIVSNPPARWEGESGHITAERILELSPNVEDKLYYMSGPEPMMETLFKDFQKLGVDTPQLVTDYFPGYETIS